MHFKVKSAFKTFNIWHVCLCIVLYHYLISWSVGGAQLTGELSSNWTSWHSRLEESSLFFPSQDVQRRSGVFNNSFLQHCAEQQHWYILCTAKSSADEISSSVNPIISYYCFTKLTGRPDCVWRSEGTAAALSLFPVGLWFVWWRRKAIQLWGNIIYFLCIF